MTDTAMGNAKSLARSAAPPGTWHSPVDSALVCSSGIEFGNLQVTSSAEYWTERRPHEGRVVIVRCADGGEPIDVISPPWSAATSVHEYGGRSYVAVDAGPVSWVYFTNSDDGRVYRHRIGDAQPTAISPVPVEGENLRYVSPVVTADGSWLICVRERHFQGDVVNELVAIATDGSMTVCVLVSGPDFVASPTLAPDGSRLAWTTWDLPDMPWDSTRLWEADIVASRDGGELRLVNHRLVVGTERQAITQPRYDANGVLYFVSDLTGWWSVWKRTGQTCECVLDNGSDLAEPEWSAGQSSWSIADDGTIAAISIRNGVDELVVLRPGSDTIATLSNAYTSMHGLQIRGQTAYVIAANGVCPPSIVAISLADGSVMALTRPADIGFPESYVSVPESITVAGADGTQIQAFLYAPVNPDYALSADRPPPLIVNVHGGPTLRTSAAFNPEVQFWTTRGFAYVDVNYRGSAGFGRDYRRMLNGQWGITDVADCVAVALHVARLGLANPSQMMIRGRSAGGYTTLMALATSAVFAAGASYWGVGDLELFAASTHKFESGYAGVLVGCGPGEVESYRARSPVRLAGQITAPVLIVQGTDDRIVPLSQAELLHAELSARGIEHSLIVFDGEGHGLRHASNAARALDEELRLYQAVIDGTVTGRPAYPNGQ